MNVHFSCCQQPDRTANKCHYLSSPHLLHNWMIEASQERIQVYRNNYL